MTNTTRRGLGLIGISLLLGILGDALLRSTPWGINIPLWLALAIAGGWALLPDGPAARKLSGWPIGLAMLFALLLAWRDSGFLQLWNTIAILAALTLPILESKGVKLGVARVTDYALGVTSSAGHAIRGLLAPLTNDIAWGELGRYRNSTGAVVIGSTLAIPAVLVFGTLLASADKGFAKITGTLIDFDVATVASHTFLTGFLAWVTAGYLSPLVGETAPAEKAVAITGPKLGIVEVGTPLAAVSGLFLTFIGLQVGYLFGGEAAMSAAGMTYAEYARDGFVQLVSAAALVLPLLLGADWLLGKRTVKNVTIFGTLSITLIGLVGLLMISALHRVAMYVGEYGLTEIRLYATVFLAWVGILQVILLTTVLRGQPQRFAFRSVLSGLGVLFVLNLSNPEALIAKSQIARSFSGAGLDVGYLSLLSDDATPAIAASMSRFSPSDACELYHREFNRLGSRTGADWRSWNYARSRAQSAASITSVTIWASCPSPWGAASPAGGDYPPR